MTKQARSSSGVTLNGRPEGWNEVLQLPSSGGRARVAGGLWSLHHRAERVVKCVVLSFYSTTLTIRYYTFYYYVTLSSLFCTLLLCIFIWSLSKQVQLDALSWIELLIASRTGAYGAPFFCKIVAALFCIEFALLILLEISSSFGTTECCHISARTLTLLLFEAIP